MGICLHTLDPEDFWLFQQLYAGRGNTAGHAIAALQDMTRGDYGRAYEQGFHPTVRFLVSKGVPCDAAEETAQAAWTRGWERIGQLRDEEAVRTWVNTIALNMYRRNTHIDNRKEPLLDCAVKPDPGAASIELASVLNSCCPSDRLLLQFQLYGFTTSEMAHQVGATEAAVRIRLMRARRSARSASQSKAPAKVTSKRYIALATV
jgi:DNA-directed RNA polymerase specialized sigma24 family protein